MEDPNRKPLSPRPSPSQADAPLGEEPQNVQRGIAEPDKRARTGRSGEPVRNTPPAGAWNDSSAD
jgi:hypothetical protein